MPLLADRNGRRIEYAGLAAGIEKTIRFLNAGDRKLLELTLQKRLSRSDAGALVGLSAGAVTRKIHNLLRRLNDPLVRALVDTGQLLPEFHQAVGLAYFLRRTPIRQIVRDSGLSSYEVKRIITYIRGWHGAGRRRET